MPKRKLIQKPLTDVIKNAAKSKKLDLSSEATGSPRNIESNNVINASKDSANGKNEKKLMNRIDTDLSVINISCDKLAANGKSWNFKISSWNVVSLKSLVNKKGMEYVKWESPDIMCFQETKCSEKKVPANAKLEEYHRYFVSSVKEGYAGVALYSKTKPLNVKYGIGNKEFDTEGRVITAEFEKFFLVTTYVPNAGRGLVTLPKRMKWDPLFRTFLTELDSKKPVIVCGDFNVAHTEIDLKNPATNTKTAGFTEEERSGFTALLNEGFVDTFRQLYPDKTGAYTYWNYIGNARSRNAGWRLDYFIVSKRFWSNICDNVIQNEVYGSDHCPITLFLSI